MGTTPNRWSEIRAIFEAALDLDATSRLEFLDEACGADRELRREVDALLSAAADEDFLSESRVDLGLRAIEAEIEIGRVGARVGP